MKILAIEIACDSNGTEFVVQRYGCSRRGKLPGQESDEKIRKGTTFAEGTFSIANC